MDSHAGSSEAVSDDDMKVYVPLKDRRAMEEARRAAKRGRPMAAGSSGSTPYSATASDSVPAANAEYDFGPGARAGESLFDQARRAMEAGEAPTELDKQRSLERDLMAQVALVAVNRCVLDTSHF